MEAMEMLSTRASSMNLAEPAPDDAALGEIFTAALRAPDHGALRPWRIFVVRGEARARLGDVLAEIEGGSPEAMERARKKPLRSPLVILVAALVKESPKAPEVEQIISAGAVAHGILLGLHAKGFAGAWRTGAPVYDARLKRALGLRDTDHLIAIIYAGTPAAPPHAMERPTADAFVTEWNGA